MIGPVEVADVRYVVLGPRGELVAWPKSFIVRAWLALRGWQFVENSLAEDPRRWRWLHKPGETVVR